MWFFSKPKLNPGWLALGFNTQGVSFAHIRRQAEGRPEVLRCEFHLWHAAGSEAPNVLQEELKSAIRWRIKDFLNYSIDDAMVDAILLFTNGRITKRLHVLRQCSETRVFISLFMISRLVPAARVFKR